ncbi:NUDIX hydrolase [Flavobacterium akiainvivens]|nr:CoA pyrophosphatase [Flavobacterium akiainvivens]
MSVQLPAINAHLKMAPVERAKTLNKDYYSNNNPRNSSVLILCYPKNQQSCFILIQRNTYTGIHSAQVSFPGGKQEANETLEQTALREAYEEVGILPGGVNMIMSLSSIYIPPSNFLVYPFLGVINESPEFIPSPDEVERIIEVPLEKLLDDNSIINTTVMVSYRDNIMVPAFTFNNNIVWGATAMILAEFKEIIKTVL